jgi:hypothetical protein
VAGVAAITLVGASLGVVAAQGAPTGIGQPPAGHQQGGRQQDQQQFIAALAARLGVSTEQLQQAMDQTRSDLGIQGRGPGGRSAREGGSGRPR